MRKLLMASLLGVSLSNVAPLAAQDDLWFAPGKTGPRAESPESPKLWFAPQAAAGASAALRDDRYAEGLWFSPSHTALPAKPLPGMGVQPASPSSPVDTKIAGARTKLNSASGTIALGAATPTAQANSQSANLWFELRTSKTASPTPATETRPNPKAPFPIAAAADAGTSPALSQSVSPQPVSPQHIAKQHHTAPQSVAKRPNAASPSSESLIPEAWEFAFTEDGYAPSVQQPEPTRTMRQAELQELQDHVRNAQFTPAGQTTPQRQGTAATETRLSLSDASPASDLGEPEELSPGVYYTLADNLFSAQDVGPQASASDRPGDDFLSTGDMTGPLRSADAIFGGLQLDDDLRQHAALITTGPRPDNQDFAWMPVAYTWISPVFYHHPLYFEQPNLERYGLGRSRIVQPLASSVHFFGSIPLVPYKTLTHHPREKVYTLGNGRPGNCVPIQRGVVLGQSHVGEVLMFWEPCSGY